MREYTSAKDEAALRSMYEGDTFIMNAINEGFPLCCCVSTDAFLRHAPALYRGCVLVAAATVREAVREHMRKSEAAGLMLYGSEAELSALREDARTALLRTDAPAAALAKFGRFGYRIRHVKREPESKVPTVTLSRRDGALLLSAYNPDTTTESVLSTPLGAPLLLGMESEIERDEAHVHLSRAEHRECRVFIEQESGVVSCRECAPVSAKYRRCIRLRGLSDATVRFVPERGCEAVASRTDSPDASVTADPSFVWVHDPVYGDYLEGHGISGSLLLRLGHKNA